MVAGSGLKIGKLERLSYAGLGKGSGAGTRAEKSHFWRSRTPLAPLRVEVRRYATWLRSKATVASVVWAKSGWGAPVGGATEKSGWTSPSVTPVPLSVPPNPSVFGSWIQVWP